MRKAIKRIINRDIKKQEDLKDSNIYIEFNETNILEAHAIIFGPEDTPYDGALIYLKINFPINYPFVPPIITYISNGNSIRIHPNIYKCGKICLSILGTWSGPNWTSIMDISSVLLSIKSLLDNNPLYNEPGYNISNECHRELSETYNKSIIYNKVYNLYLRNSLNIPSEFIIFKDVIDKHFKDKKDMINNIIEKNINDTCHIMVPLYGINQTIKYYNIKFD